MPLITLTTQLGSGGQEIAKLVGEGLGLDVFDDERLLSMGPDVGISSEGLEEMGKPGFFHRMFSQQPQIYLDYMDSIVYEVSRLGNGVVIGHGSQMLLRDFGCALHVLVHAPDSVRIQNVVQKQKLSSRAAEKLIHKTDSRQKGFFRMAFEKDLDNLALYDLSINTSKLSSASAANFIIEAARAEEINVCSLTALESMEKLSEVKRVHAALMEKDLDSHMLNIEVAEKGVIELSGLAHSKDTIGEIVEVVQGVPGVSEVRSELVAAPPLYGG
ncbi:cytidylate kinase family protein [Thermodesulfobacteriota bacterium]